LNPISPTFVHSVCSPKLSEQTKQIFERGRRSLYLLYNKEVLQQMINSDIAIWAANKLIEIFDKLPKQPFSKLSQLIFQVYQTERTVPIKQAPKIDSGKKITFHKRLEQKHAEEILAKGAPSVDMDPKKLHFFIHGQWGGSDRYRTFFYLLLKGSPVHPLFYNRIKKDEHFQTSKTGTETWRYSLS